MKDLKRISKAFKRKVSEEKQKKIKNQTLMYALHAPHAYVTAVNEYQRSERGLISTIF